MFALQLKKDGYNSKPSYYGEYFVVPTDEYLKQYDDKFIHTINQKYVCKPDLIFAKLELGLACDLLSSKKNSRKIRIELFDNYANQYFKDVKNIDFIDQNKLFIGLGKRLLKSALIHFIKNNKKYSFKNIFIFRVAGSLPNKNMSGLYDYYQSLGFTKDNNYELSLSTLLENLEDTKDIK